MPIVYGPALPPIPNGLTPTGASILREQLEEDTFQTIGEWIQRASMPVYNVVVFGADPTGKTSSTTAFNNAYAAAMSVRGKVFIPNGTYQLTDRTVVGHRAVNEDDIHYAVGYDYTMGASYSASQLALARSDQYIDIEGESPGGVVLWCNWTSSTGKAAIFYGVSTSVSKTNTYSGSIRNLVIIGKEGMTGTYPTFSPPAGTDTMPATNHQVGIATVLSPVQIINVTYRELDRGVVRSDCYWGTDEKCRAEHCGTGFTWLNANATHSFDNLASSCRTLGYLITGQEFDCNGCHTENCAVSSWVPKADQGSISNSYWEGTYASDTDWSVKIGNPADPSSTQVIGLTLSNIHHFSTYGKGFKFHSTYEAVMLNCRSYNTDSILNNQYCYVSLIGYGFAFDLASSNASAVLCRSGAAIPWRPPHFGSGDRAGIPAVRGDLIINSDYGQLNLFNGNTWDEFTADGSVSVKSPMGGVQGALGDDSNDDTSRIQNAINYAKIRGQVLVIPPGTYHISTTLFIQDVAGFTLRGGARGGTVLKWVGASGTPMIDIKNSQYVTLENFRMTGNTVAGNRPQCFIMSESNTSSARAYVPTGNCFRNLVLGTGAANEATYGIIYQANGAASDTNNSEGFHQNVLINGVTEAGYSFEHSQSKAHRIEGGGVVGAKCAVATNRGGAGAQGGSFSWVEAAASQCSVACFDLGNSNDPIYIERLTSEGSSRLLQTGGPSGSTFGITFQSCRFSTDALNVDNKAIKYKWRGPLNLIGNIFDAGGNPALIELTFNTDGVANIIGNAWNSTSSSAATCIVLGSAAGHVHMEGNVYADGAGAAVIQERSGTVTVADAATTSAVTFSVPEHDTNYRLSLEPVAITGGASAGSSRVRSIAKTTTGFTITVEAAPGAGTSVAFDWTLTRV